jgi:hypothetical protein
MEPIWTIFKRGFGNTQGYEYHLGDFLKEIPTTQTDNVFWLWMLDCHIKRYAIEH